MEIQLENPTPVKKIVNITIPKETVSDELNKEYLKIRKKASIKGFRKGKVPLHMIKKLYENSAKYEVLDRLINESVREAILEKEIVYVGEPMVKEVSDLEEDKELKVTVEFDCIEDFELKDYKGIEIEVEKLEVTDDMYKEALDNILERFTYYEDVEDESVPIEQGFQVVAEIEAFVDGEKNEKFSKDEIVLTIGDNFYLPGFDDYFIGLTKNDETEVKHSVDIEGENKEGSFKIKVKWIKKPVVPELDEEFISQFGEEYKSVDDFKEKVRKELEENFEKQMRDMAIDKIMAYLREKHKFQVPQSLIDKQIEFNQKNMPKLPKEDDAYKKRIQELSENQVFNSIILDKIERAENIKLEEKDFDKEFEKLAAQFRIEKKKVKEFYSQNTELMQNLFNKLLTEKTFDFLINNAKINYVTKEKDTESQNQE